MAPSLEGVRTPSREMSIGGRGEPSHGRDRRGTGGLESTRASTSSSAARNSEASAVPALQSHETEFDGMLRLLELTRRDDSRPMLCRHGRRVGGWEERFERHLTARKAHWTARSFARGNASPVNW
eukprot:scaffold8631_cov28-Tisochrysis_lutea.AAC.2